MSTRLRFSAISFLSLFLIAAAGRAQPDPVVVLTTLPATFSVTSSLATGTAIEVRNIPENGRRMSSLAGLFQQRSNQFTADFSEADAVVTIGKLWREDPLFTAARMANVRVVDIDATKPWSMTLEGISVAMEPEPRVPWAEGSELDRKPSIYFWLSPANGARMAEIIAADLIRLAPAERAAIEGNLAALRAGLLDLKLEYELKLAELTDVTLFALASEFVYLTMDLGLYVDGYFLKQDIDWTTEDLEAFEAYLLGNDIGVVIHKWEPDERIENAVSAGGARLVVLDPIDAGLVEAGKLLESSYLDLLRADLEALYSALLAANR
jgi:ABC-type Zn uptake system ZnuABC Zn-binding protein ZnuA